MSKIIRLIFIVTILTLLFQHYAYAAHSLRLPIGSEDDTFSRVKEAGFRDLSVKSQRMERAEKIRSHCKYIKRVIEEHNLLQRAWDFMKKEQPGLQPVLGVEEPRERLITLLSNVAGIARQAAGHDFDAVVYFASGSDLITAAQFSDNIITADSNNIFYAEELWDETRLAKRLENKLLQKLSSGMHSVHDIRNLTDYAMELVLMGADMDSLRVLDERQIGENKSVITVEFNAGGRMFNHRHFRYVWGSGFYKRDMFLVRELQGLIDSGDICVLSKGGRMYSAGPNFSVSAVYPLLPDGAIIVSDVDRSRILHNSARVKDLKENNPAIKRQLDELQKPVSQTMSRPQTGSLIRRRLNFGYATDIRDINFYRVIKPDKRLTKNRAKSFL